MHASSQISLGLLGRVHGLDNAAFLNSKSQLKDLLLHVFALVITLPFANETC